MTEEWRYVLVNGKTKRVEVKDPTYEKGKLVSIGGLRPLNNILVEGSAPPEPTVSDANDLKRVLYSNFFRKPFKNLLILAAAGASMDVQGPSMLNLWEKAKEKYRISNGDEIIEEGFDIICKSVKYNPEKTDIESLLSKIEGTCKFSEDKTIVLNKKAKLLSVIKEEIFNLIKDNCTLSKPLKSENFPHKVFLEKLLQRKQTNPRVKVFTLNYDLLFEYAATEVNAVVIDGFSFTYPRTFSGRFFDLDIVQREGSKLKEEDNFIQRVIHLHKLHGSLNWERVTSDNKVIIKENPKRPLMVYPRESKYEDSYEQPFFEMMARFQRNLRLNDDTILVCIGYSFNDKHINTAIEEALNQNPSFRLAIVDPYFDSRDASKEMNNLKKEALNSERIIMISETFSDFADYFPELQTYNSELPTTMYLKADD